MTENEVFEMAINYLTWIANKTAEVSAYDWNADFCKKEVKENFKSFRKRNEDKELEFWKKVFELPVEKKELLRFCKFDEKSDKMLIPLWIIECLPENFDVEVESIDGQKCSIKNIDKDVRFGCVAYMI